MRLAAYSMTFDGAVLQRGFWLYIWRITTDTNATVIYVGRTGDSSSPHAASPFQRIGAHLDARAKAKGNALARQLRKAGLQSHVCRYEMTAVGPLFPEQASMERHIPIRDKVAALETCLASYLESRGYTVIGDHGLARECDPAMWTRVRELVDSKFPDVPPKANPR